jgi:hypothetical protein
MKIAFLLSLALSLPAGMASAQGTSPAQRSGPAQSIERNFAPGGTVKMDLAAGEYVIRPGASADKVNVRWRTDKPEKAEHVRVTVEVEGSECRIVARGPRNSFHVEVELPSRADLHVHLSAGDINVRGIEGNKNIECRAGDITVDIGRADDYGPVDASVRIGDFEAPPLGASKGGFARKFKWQGPGKYALHAHVGVGSLSFLGVPTARK